LREYIDDEEEEKKGGEKEERGKRLRLNQERGFKQQIPFL